MILKYCTFNHKEERVKERHRDPFAVFEYTILSAWFWDIRNETMEAMHRDERENSHDFLQQNLQIDNIFFIRRWMCAFNSILKSPHELCCCRLMQIVYVQSCTWNVASFLAPICSLNKIRERFWEDSTWYENVADVLTSNRVKPLNETYLSWQLNQLVIPSPLSMCRR